VEHTQGQERTFSGLSDEVDRKLGTGEPASLPQPVRVEEDGTLLEMRTNLPLSNEEIASGSRKFLAA